MATKKPKPLPVPLPFDADTWPAHMKVVVKLLQEGPLPTRGEKLVHACVLMLEALAVQQGYEVFFAQQGTLSSNTEVVYNVTRGPGTARQPVASFRVRLWGKQKNRGDVDITYGVGVQRFVARSRNNGWAGREVVAPRGSIIPNVPEEQIHDIAISAATIGHGNTVLGFARILAVDNLVAQAWLEQVDRALYAAAKVKKAATQATGAKRKVITDLIEALYLAQSDTDRNDISLVPATAIPHLTTRGASHPRGALDPRLVAVLRGTVWTLKPTKILQYDPAVVGPDHVFFWSGTEWTTLQDRTVNWADFHDFYARPFNPALDSAPMGDHEPVVTGMLRDYGVTLAWAQLGQPRRWLLPSHTKRERIKNLISAMPSHMRTNSPKHTNFWASAAFGYFSPMTEVGIGFVISDDGNTHGGVITNHGPRKPAKPKDGETVATFEPRDQADKDMRAAVEALIAEKLDRREYLPAGRHRILPLPTLLERL